MSSFYNTGLSGIKKLTRAQYDALTIKDANTKYIVTDSGSVCEYLGEIRIGSSVGIIVSSVSSMASGDIVVTELPADGGYDGEAVEGLKDWLDENVPDFFSGGYEISLPYGSGSKILTMYPISGDTTAKIEMSANVKTYGITTASGVHPSSNKDHFVPRYVAKLDGGFAVILKDSNERDTEYASLFFGKDESGRVTCGGCLYINTYYTVFSTCFSETAQSQMVYLSSVYSSAGTTAASMDVLRRSASQTLLAPVITMGSHTQKLLVTPCTSYPASTGLERVSMDGDEYLYNGLFAMKGGT